MIAGISEMWTASSRIHDSDTHTDNAVHRLAVVSAIQNLAVVET